MSVFERIKDLNLPAGEFIVEGSGVLDALGIRESRDLDIVVAQPAFERLQERGFALKTKDNDPYLESGEVEVWLSFDGKYFTQLMDEAMQIEGYYFASLELIRDWKQRRGLDKDKRDLVLIEEYLRKQRPAKD